MDFGRGWLICKDATPNYYGGSISLSQSPEKENMHYYKFNIADYRKDTNHLTPIEHGIYRQLIDWYYLDEKPIPLETQVVIRRLRLGIDEVGFLQNVLEDFFILGKTGYTHKRIDVEIKDYHAQAEKNKNNGKLGGRPKKTQPVMSGLPDDSENNPNHKPITINHKPLTKEELLKEKIKKENATAARLPSDWEPSLQDIEFCQLTRPDLTPHDIASGFRDYWIAQPGAKGKKLDWSATWRNWVRNARQPAQQRPQAQYQSATDKAKTLADRLTGRVKNERIIDIN